MRQFSLISLLLSGVVLFGFGTPLLGHDHDHDPAAEFVGVWAAVHGESPKGINTNQRGLMIVHGNYVCHMNVAKERPLFSKENTAEEKVEIFAELWRKTTASCGTFTLDHNTVTVNWTTSANPRTEGHVTKFLLTSEEDKIKLAPAANPEFKVVYQRLN